jgi:hypothetical protein
VTQVVLDESFGDSVPVGSNPESGAPPPLPENTSPLAPKGLYSQPKCSEESQRDQRSDPKRYASIMIWEVYIDPNTD